MWYFPAFRRPPFSLPTCRISAFQLPHRLSSPVSHVPNLPSHACPWISPLVLQLDVKRTCRTFFVDPYLTMTVNVTWHVVVPCLMIGPLLCLITCIPRIMIRRKAMRSRRARDAKKKKRVGPASQQSRTASSTRTESSTAATGDDGLGLELQPPAIAHDATSPAAAGHVSFSEPESRLSRPPSPTRRMTRRRCRGR